MLDLRVKKERIDTDYTILECLMEMENGNKMENSNKLTRRKKERSK